MNTLEILEEFVELGVMNPERRKALTDLISSYKNSSHRTIAQLLISLDKALTRPEILPYLKAQILTNTREGLNKVNEREINELLSNSSSQDSITNRNANS